jgi:hypothetical protein
MRLEKETAYYDYRQLEIGRTDADFNFYPAIPGMSAQGCAEMPIHYKEIHFDWELCYYQSNNNLDRSAKKFLVYLASK